MINPQSRSIVDTSRLFNVGASVYYPTLRDNGQYKWRWGIIENMDNSYFYVHLVQDNKHIQVSIGDRALCLTHQECEYICNITNVNNDLASLPEHFDFEINPEIVKEYGDDCKHFLEHLCRKLTVDERNAIYAFSHSHSYSISIDIPAYIMCNNDSMVDELSDKVMRHTFMYDGDAILLCEKYNGKGIKIIV